MNTHVCKIVFLAFKGKINTTYSNQKLNVPLKEDCHSKIPHILSGNISEILNLYHQALAGDQVSLKENKYRLVFNEGYMTGTVLSSLAVSCNPNRNPVRLVTVAALRFREVNTSSSYPASRQSRDRIQTHMGLIAKLVLCWVKLSSVDYSMIIDDLLFQVIFLVFSGFLFYSNICSNFMPTKSVIWLRQFF